MKLSSFLGFLIVFGVMGGAVQVGWGVWKQQQRAEGVERVEPPVEAERELIEVGL